MDSQSGVMLCIHHYWVRCARWNKVTHNHEKRDRITGRSKWEWLIADYAFPVILP